MDFQQGIRSALNIADYVAFGYLADLTDEEMLMRAVPDSNHVSWQLGHVILAERMLVEAAKPDSMPTLPSIFADKHSKGMACSDIPSHFLKKEEYLEFAKVIRAGTLEVLESMTPEDFDKPVSGRVPPFVKNVGDCFTVIGPHWIGHAGQWVVLRRKLNRPRLF